jgi:tripartite-type tricarboxylate transporter receptor subunit TctC
MKNIFKKWLISGLLVLLGALPLASSAAWPDDQTIELIVGFAPGGGTDLMARALVPFVEKKLSSKARIVVVNKPGAGGEISSAYIARAKPDGYTIGFINVPGFVFIPMYKQSSYQTDDLKIIARVVDDPAVLVMHKKSKYRTLPELLAALKKDPGSLSFATSGRGTSGHQALLKIEQASGVKGTDIAFKGAGDFKSAVIGGHVDYAFSSIGEFLNGYSDSDVAVAMLVVNPTRVAVIKDVPSIKEFGFDVRVSSERGIAGPKAMPQDIADRLQKAIQDTLADPEFLKTIKNDAPLVAFMSGAEWTKSLESMPAELMPFVSKMKE